MKIKNDIRKNELYRERYFELTQEPIPLLTDNLELQIKFEECIIRAYLQGYEKAKRGLNYKISQLKYRNKIQRERIRGLELLTKKKGREKYSER